MSKESDGMAFTDLSKPIKFNASEWEQLNKTLEGKQMSKHIEGQCKIHNEWATEVGCESCYIVGIRKQRDAEIIKLLDEMAETAKSTRTKKGVTTFWAIENAKAIIKGEQE